MEKKKIAILGSTGSIGTQALEVIDHFSDEFGEDTALQIITVVDWLVENGIKSEHAYKDFEEYYHEHTSLFNNERKNKILKTCEKIAQSFANVNNKEKKMLEKVKKLFSANA
jgi:1-deoxy-D-xylulose 5-phosphate reductoisomerase